MAERNFSTAVSSQIDRVAKSDASVLLEGETGTGKSTLAWAIHAQSTRAAEPFVVFDCAAVAPQLIESALFGHQKGAFTGAHQDRVGALQAAGAGTLFFDEIGELAREQQPRLLRALEERVFVPLGATHPVKFHARVIAASQGGLADQVRAKAFREDLYYRLAVFRIEVPPLRERQTEVPALIDALFAEFEAPNSFASLTPRTAQKLIDYHWPGNIRELRNVVQRLIWQDEASALAMLTEAVKPHARTLSYDATFAEFKRTLLEEHERRYCERLLERFDHNITRAAQGAKMNRRYLYSLLHKYGLTHGRDSS